MSSLLFEEKGVKQGVVRTSRYKLRNIIGAVLRLQAWLRGTSIRWALRACSHAAAVIQALLRGVQARRRCLQLRCSEELLSYAPSGALRAILSGMLTYQ